MRGIFLTSTFNSRKRAYNMDNRVNINNNSVDTAGITKDYKEALAEIIWNGFDAQATEININFSPNQIDYINELIISDNGTGIDFSNLNETFGAFLDSIKRKSFQRSSYVRGKKGKGRFSFIAFAHTATWFTTYLDSESGKLLDYEIIINANNKDIYKDENHKISSLTYTGTKLVLSNLFNVTGYSFNNEEILSFLRNEFGWFLLLNQDNNYKLSINGEAIDFQNIIADHEIFEKAIKDANDHTHSFTITYVRWNEKIGDKFYYYFLNDEKKESYKQLTSYNNNAISFYHSVYVQSSFFNDFTASADDTSAPLFGINQSNPVFKVLLKTLQQIIEDKQKLFVRNDAADQLIAKYERNGIFPKFNNNKYEQAKRKDLVDVVKEIYCIQPKIFKGLNETQEKTSIGFINLLLDSNERENILTILEDIVHLSVEERENLATLLKKTSFNKIVKTINLIENRFKIVDLLRTLVFDLKQFTNERDHIQHAIAENYWLFGEQFHLVTANEGFENLLSNYLYIIDNAVQNNQSQIDDSEKNRRPDIFMCRQRSLPDPLDHDGELEENIMVELKRPTVTIGKEQLRQIEDYMDFITRQDAFNAQTRIWKFYVLSNKVDDYCRKQYEEFKDKGKRYLVKSWGNLEIFAMTWDDVFKTFEIKHKYLLDKLDFDKNAIRAELKAKGISFTKDAPNAVMSILKDSSVN